jgi:hypothetical protein
MKFIKNHSIMKISTVKMAKVHILNKAREIRQKIYAIAVCSSHVHIEPIRITPEWPIHFKGNDAFEKGQG